MKIRALLTTGAAMATVAAVAVAAPSLTRGSSAAQSLSPAAAAQALPTVAPPPGMRIHVLNLHQQYARILAGKPAVTGPEAGVVPMLSGHGQAAAGTATTTALISPSATGTCNEPDCDLKWGGGPVQHAPHVYLLLWGPDWKNAGLPTEVANYLTAFFAGLGQASDSWSTITSQYKDKTGNPTFVKPVFDPSTDVYNDPVMPAAAANPKIGLTSTDIGTEALTLLSHITDTADAQVVVASQSGTCFADGFAGDPAGCGPPPNQSPDYCGWHDAVQVPSTTAYLPYINLPWQLDASYGCGANFVNSGRAGLLDGWSLVGGHEYAEAVTDPAPETGWIDPNDLDISGGEIADKCVWAGEPFRGQRPLRGRHAADREIRDAVAVEQRGPPVRDDDEPQAVRRRAARPEGRPGQDRQPAAHHRDQHRLPEVQGDRAAARPVGQRQHRQDQREARGDRGDVQVEDHDLGLRQVGDHRGQVVRQLGARRGQGVRRQVRRLFGRPEQQRQQDRHLVVHRQGTQQVTFAANRELQVLGKCVTGGTSSVFLEPCEDTSNQAWTRQSNGEYVLAASGKCLTDPASAKANGTKLGLAASQEHREPALVAAVAGLAKR